MQINIDKVDLGLNAFTDELLSFFRENDIKPPAIDTARGLALLYMDHYPKYYWDRDSATKLFQKRNIETKDAIQPFNKWRQVLKSINEKGKYGIIKPYEFSINYYKRNKFKFSGNMDEVIENTKKEIKHYYIDDDNWTMGHKNPELPLDETNSEIQPSIQQSYRDDYIFIGLFKMMPVAHKLEQLYKKGEIKFTESQLNKYIEFFTTIKNNLSHS